MHSGTKLCDIFYAFSKANYALFLAILGAFSVLLCIIFYSHYDTCKTPYHAIDFLCIDKDDVVYQYPWLNRKHRYHRRHSTQFLPALCDTWQACWVSSQCPGNTIERRSHENIRKHKKNSFHLLKCFLLGENNFQIKVETYRSVFPTQFENMFHTFHPDEKLWE